MLDKRIVRSVALDAVLQAGKALSFAHGRGLIHRDVKPQNILLDSAAQAFLTDFDLVQAPGSTGGTRTGAMVGTYVYASPEAMEDGGNVDHRADVYSLGMTLMFILHGKALSPRAVYDRDGFINAIPCDPALGKLLRAATALDPADRPATVAEFCARLSQVMLSTATENSSRGPLDLAPALDVSVTQSPRLSEGQVQIPSSWRDTIGSAIDKTARMRNFLSKKRFTKSKKYYAGIAVFFVMLSSIIMLGLLWHRLPARDNKSSVLNSKPASSTAATPDQPTQSRAGATGQQDTPSPQASASHSALSQNGPPKVETEEHSEPSKSTRATPPPNPLPASPPSKKDERSKSSTKRVSQPGTQGSPPDVSRETLSTALSVNAVMRRAMGSVARCFPEGGAPPKVSVDVTVGTDGKVIEGSVDGADGHAACVLGAIKGLRFSPATDSDSYSIRYDFLSLGLIRR